MRRMTHITNPPLRQVTASAQWMQEDSFPPSATAYFKFWLDGTGVSSPSIAVDQLRKFIEHYPLLIEVIISLHSTDFDAWFDNHKAVLDELMGLCCGDTKVTPRLQFFTPLMSMGENLIARFDEVNTISDVLTVVLTINSSDVERHGREEIADQFSRVTAQLGERSIAHAAFVYLDSQPEHCAQMIFLFRALSVLAEEKNETQVWFESAFHKFSDEGAQLKFYTTILENQIFLVDRAHVSPLLPCGYLGVAYSRLLLGKLLQNGVQPQPDKSLHWCCPTHSFSFILDSQGAVRTCPYAESPQLTCPLAEPGREVEKFSRALEAYIETTGLLERLPAHVTNVNIISRMEDYTLD
jgi:hypothetical protein